MYVPDSWTLVYKTFTEEDGSNKGFSSYCENQCQNWFSLLSTVSLAQWRGAEDWAAVLGADTTACKLEERSVSTPDTAGAASHIRRQHGQHKSMLTNFPSLMTFAPASQFHVYLSWVTPV